MAVRTGGEGSPPKPSAAALLCGPPVLHPGRQEWGQEARLQRSVSHPTACVILAWARTSLVRGPHRSCLPAPSWCLAHCLWCPLHFSFWRPVCSQLACQPTRMGTVLFPVGPGAWHGAGRWRVLVWFCQSCLLKRQLVHLGLLPAESTAEAMATLL